MRSGIFGAFVFLALAVSPGASGGQAIIQELRARALGEQHSLGP